MSPVVSEVLRSGYMISSSLRRRTHLVQSFSVVFLYWFYVFSRANRLVLPLALIPSPRKRPYAISIGSRISTTDY
ncbi:hypothetical protein MLD38_034399 [Melastoma candidum]|uniref:Uncharacterized protein n=1 Tax=Melastoma candidum TaxID=119954 RepID=A0ACB9MDI4_9MYRT|nr:hypothetical protein MLD38_034399 [Melastoma candidum]